MKRLYQLTHPMAGILALALTFILAAANTRADIPFVITGITANPGASGTTTTIAFTAPGNPSPSAFNLLSSPALNGTFASATGAVITGGSGAYQAIVVATNPTEFYQIMTNSSGGTVSDCPGPYTASAVITNNVGGIWITPPPGVTDGVLTDESPYPPPYASAVKVTRKSDGMTWCAGGSVSFPVSSGDQFEMEVFVISSPPPSGPLTLQITWL